MLTVVPTRSWKTAGARSMCFLHNTCIRLRSKERNRAGNTTPCIYGTYLGIKRRVSRLPALARLLLSLKRTFDNILTRRTAQLLTDLYDLPQALRDSTKGISTIQHMTAAVKPVPYSGAIGHMTPLRSSPQIAATPGTEDWAFLRDFGDSTDQFYDWDTELRNLLNSNLQNDLAEYGFA
jgi:hypothetical protein